ncbi:MAG: hypothetical protein QM534_07165 [Sediminibacterium sp.]|nr:hypothetical protein [Sediminibacterium sp.]
MKKIIVSLMSFATSTTVFAQDSIAKIPPPPPPPLMSEIDHPGNNISYVDTLMPLFAITLVIVLVIQVTRYILDHKLKNKIIDRNISEQLATSILDKSATDKKNDSIKWAFLLLGLGLGLTITYHTMPLHIHSMAIISFCIGLSFLAYYFFLKHSKK